MKRLNYDILTSYNPTIYSTVVNTLGQQIDLVEHPTKGDAYPVIAIYKEEKIAMPTDFFDVEDLEEGDYMPVFINGDMLSSYELD